MARRSSIASGRRHGNTTHEQLAELTKAFQSMAIDLEGHLQGERLTRMLDKAGYKVTDRIDGLGCSLSTVTESSSRETMP